ncbi:MAG: hypothetical protein HC806_00640 [Anaerolineae bacterium]|nr:hypothetical protein [Anaerolineae bacterium]
MWKIGGDQIFPLLHPLIHHPQERVRSEALRVLAQRGYKPEKHQEIVEVVRAEAQALTRWSNLYRQLEANASLETQFFQDALTQIILRGRLRVVDLAILLTPHQNLAALRENLFSSNEQVRGNALELLDVSLAKEKEVRATIVTIAGSQSPIELSNLLAKQFPQKSKDLSVELLSIFDPTDGPIENDWLATCALYALHIRTPELLTLDILDSAIRTNSLLLCKTANEIKTNSKLNTDGAFAMLLIEKTLILKSASIFSDTPDDILAELANYTEEYRVVTGDTIFEKGSTGIVCISSFPARCAYTMGSGRSTRCPIEMCLGKWHWLIQLHASHL